MANRFLAPYGRSLRSHGIDSPAHRPRRLTPRMTMKRPSWRPVSRARSPQRAVAGARAAGLGVADLREQALRVEFYDVGAVVHFLRKVPWTVPGFTVDGYRDRLARMHERIRARGPFVSHAQRFLVEARKPRSTPGG